MYCNIFVTLILLFSLYLQEHILQFIRDVFSFEKVAYTTVDQLSSDIHALARQAAVRSMTQLAPDRWSYCSLSNRQFSLYITSQLTHEYFAGSNSHLYFVEIFF